VTTALRAQVVLEEATALGLDIADLIAAADVAVPVSRARSVLPWAARTPVSAHVLRHTAITAVARIGGYPVAQAFAGHNPPSVTGRYLHATVAEVAAAVAVMTGEPHPLTGQVRPTGCHRRS